DERSGIACGYFELDAEPQHAHVPVRGPSSITDGNGEVIELDHGLPPPSTESSCCSSTESSKVTASTRGPSKRRRSGAGRRGDGAAGGSIRTSPAPCARRTHPSWPG